jgi:ATP-binding cassette, subfamily B, bacterial
MQPWEMYRSLTRDPDVLKQKLGRVTGRRILQYAKPFTKDIYFLVMLVTVDAFLVVAQPLLFKRIIDEGILKSNPSIVIISAALVAVLAIFSGLVSIVERWFSSRIGEGLIFDLRSEVFDKVQRQPIAFFTKSQTGSLISRLNNDVIGAQQAFTSTLSGLVSNIIALIVVLVTMITLSWQITFASLVLLPLFLIPARLLGRKLQALARNQMDLNAQMNQQMSERFNVSGALLIKLFGNYQNETQVFTNRAIGVRDIGIKIAMTNRIFFIALTLVATVATAFVYGFGGVLTIDGTITLGTLLALTALLSRLYGPLTALSNIRVDIMTALVSFDRVFEILDLKNPISDPKNPASLPAGGLAISLKNVSLNYSQSQSFLPTLTTKEDSNVVEDSTSLSAVELEILAGTTVAIVGPSGAGKTSLTALISRLYDATSGEVLVGGVNVKEISLQDLRSEIGVVSQDPHLFHDTIENNLRLVKPNASEQEIMQAISSAQLSDFVNSLPAGIATVVGDRGHRLSGGEKQRLAIARVFLKSPRIVILDEATAHLDAENEAQVQKALNLALANKTAIVVAHRLSTVLQADKIVVLNQGKIIESGTHQELMSHEGLYRELFETQLI